MAELVFWKTFVLIFDHNNRLLSRDTVNSRTKSSKENSYALMGEDPSDKFVSALVHKVHNKTR